MQRRPLPLILAFALATPLAALAADNAHNHGAASETHTIQLNNGKKWAIDAPLRKGMESIQASTNKTLHRIHAGKATAADYTAFNKQVNDDVAYIVKNCKLDPKADAELHGLIGQMMNGAEAAQGKQGDAKRADGVVAVAKALNTYGDYFDHKGWKKIDLGH